MRRERVGARRKILTPTSTCAPVLGTVSLGGICIPSDLFCVGQNLTSLSHFSGSTQLTPFLFTYQKVIPLINSISRQLTNKRIDCMPAEWPKLGAVRPSG